MKCIVCNKKSTYTINRGTESEVKLCSRHYNVNSHLVYRRRFMWWDQ